MHSYRRFFTSVQDIKCWTLWWSFIPKADKKLKMEGPPLPQTRKHLKRQTVEREDSVCFWGNGPVGLIGADHFQKQNRTLRTSVFLHRGAELSYHTHPQNICSQPLRNNSTLHPNRFACLHIQAHTFKSNKLTPWVFKLTVGHDIRLGWSDVVLASYGSASTYGGLVDTENVSSLSFQTYHY